MKALLAWSSGKDSAWALSELRREGRVDVVGLHTTVNETRGRVAMHAVRGSLLEAQAEAVGLPLWVVTCVDPRALPASFAGRAYDQSLLADLPAGVDPCGENGEFHTFAWDGPAFRRPVPVRPGPIVNRDGFVFADLMPEADSTQSTGRT